MALVTAPSISDTAETRSADAIGVGLERASKCGIYGLIAGGILLSPVFGFLMALLVDILIGLLKGDGIPALLALVSAGAIGGFVFRKLRPRPQDSATDWT